MSTRLPRSFSLFLMAGQVLAAGCWGSSTARTNAIAVDADPFGFCPSAAAMDPEDAGVPGTGEGDPACETAPSPSSLMGWAAVPGPGANAVSVDTTTGGEGGAVVTVSTLVDLNNALMGTTPGVVQVIGTSIAGNVRVSSNKTLVGICGAEIHGHIQISGAVNVIVRNLKITGYNCTDPNAVAQMDCSAGADAVTISGAHHVWFDHDDISDGSDGNLDINQQADNITISWTRFHYSASRIDPAGAGGGHQFSDLIGSSDSSTNDAGHLRVTFHHDWWGAHSYERMPRVRFGQVHLLNNLWTSTGNAYCVGLGVSANILVEKNVFRRVANPFDVVDYSDATSVLESRDNLFEGTTGNLGDRNAPAAPPPYDYVADDPCSVPDAVMALSGPR